MTVKRQARDDKSGTIKVTFDLPASVEANEIALVGEFNDWSPTAMKLQRAKSGAWRVTVPLEAGHRYRYRYLIDGEFWENDWRADEYERNPFGADDSVVDTNPDRKTARKTLRSRSLPKGSG
jgi:1,4-alpha-glucan branching enzyme